MQVKAGILFSSVFVFALVCFVLFVFFLITDFNAGRCLPSAVLETSSVEFLKAGNVIIDVCIHREMKTDFLLSSSFKSKCILNK